MGWLKWRPGMPGRYRQAATRVLEQATALERLEGGSLPAWLQEHAQDLRRGRPASEKIEAWLGGLVLMAERCHGFRAHPEQIMGALALRDGWLVEMATGEGKTLVAALAVLLHAAEGRRCHVLTANDYLSGRDREFLLPLAAACGLTAGHVAGDTPNDARRAEYAHPIVFSTANNVLADFLRDRLADGPQGGSLLRLARAVRTGGAQQSARLLPPLDAVIVDEADHILVDEAVTPLIISQKVDNPALVAAVAAANRVVDSLKAGVDYEIDERHHEVRLLAAGWQTIAAMEDVFPAGWSSQARRVELVETALQARAFFQRDKHYVVLEGKVVIVDESTGRLMPDRQWQLGLHQAVEAKEGLAPGAPSETAARMSFQRFFRLYEHVCGLTGTAWEARNELWDIYDLRVLRIPTHRPCIRQDHAAVFFATAAGKWDAVAAMAADVHLGGRPVLVGTRSVAASIHASSLLRQRGLEATVLNAMQHEREAEIVSQAGHGKALTIATNMAGRGTDIKLKDGVGRLGGLHVIATELHESSRVDRQLAGRAGRQGDPGSSCVLASLEDELLMRHLPDWQRRLGASLLHAWPQAGQIVCRFLARRSQLRARRAAAAQRRSVLIGDHQLEESLGVTLGR